MSCSIIRIAISAGSRVERRRESRAPPPPGTPAAGSSSSSTRGFSTSAIAISSKPLLAVGQLGDLAVGEIGDAERGELRLRLGETAAPDRGVKRIKPPREILALRHRDRDILAQATSPSAAC